jgi:hypothetical protein
MPHMKSHKRAACADPASTLPPGGGEEAAQNGLVDTPTEADERVFAAITQTTLSPEEEESIVTPGVVVPRQEYVLAVHWHPEHVPMGLIKRRIDSSFPHKSRELVIPTQHNEITTYGDYSGVEVDCYSGGFNQKVQLLLHFENSRLERSAVLKAMLSHTYRYRSSQLFEFLDVLSGRDEARLSAVASATGAAEETVRFARIHAKKLAALLERHHDELPPAAFKNKLVRNFLDAMRPNYGERLVMRVQAFVQAVKLRVKEEFPLTYFYRATEVIEEARGMGAGVVIPHPEQFWPILLAEYDVDGYEVWNPQSQRYTDFLIDVLARKNRKAGPSARKLLIFMGDDTHMGEKLRPVGANGKPPREIGLQPAWDDLAVRKKLLAAGMDRACVINEYRARLAG